jgi:hypothetical protein
MLILSVFILALAGFTNVWYYKTFVNNTPRIINLTGYRFKNAREN